MDLGKEEVFQADPIAFDAPLDVSGNLSVRILSQTFEGRRCGKRSERTEALHELY